MTKTGLRVAIDGPAGAGKSTVAQEVALRLGYLYIDTGAMYRALTWLALEKNIDLSDDAALSRLAEVADIRFLSFPEGQKVIADGQDVSEAIRIPDVSEKVSRVSAVAGVREPMVRLQRRLAENGSVVMDGRDIATHVLPNAEVKIFLTASIDERAQRRYLEMTRKGFEVNLDRLKIEIAQRDAADASREVSPLVQADDAILLDTTGLSREQVVEQVLRIVQRSDSGEVK